MKHARKPEHILRLERDDEPQQENPFNEILQTEAIEQASKRSLGIHGATKVSEMMPRLSVIARENNLNLCFKMDYDKAIQILNS